MLARRDVDLVDKAIDQMKERIVSLVNDSIRDQLYPKALECLVALRNGCVQEEESQKYLLPLPSYRYLLIFCVKRFNAFLAEVRGFYEGKRRDEFWQCVVRSKVSLISSEEADDSDVSPQESREVSVLGGYYVCRIICSKVYYYSNSSLLGQAMEMEAQRRRKRTIQRPMQPTLQLMICLI